MFYSVNYCWCVYVWEVYSNCDNQFNWLDKSVFKPAYWDVHFLHSAAPPRVDKKTCHPWISVQWHPYRKHLSSSAKDNSLHSSKQQTAVQSKTRELQELSTQTIKSVLQHSWCVYTNPEATEVLWSGFTEGLEKITYHTKEVQCSTEWNSLPFHVIA